MLKGKGGVRVQEPLKAAQNGEVLLKMEGIEKIFPGVHALNNCRFELKRGEVHALVGENGAGKSTMMKVLTGIYKRDGGTIEYKGREISLSSPEEAQAIGIGIIHQELNLMPHLSVAENIFIGRQQRRGIAIDWAKMYTEAQRLLDDLGVAIDPRRRVRGLSIADQQMVEMASALSLNARMLIMDEPTTALTRKEIDKLFDIIRFLQSQGVSILFVSHKLDEVFEIATRFTVLRNGKNVITDITSNANNEKMVFYMSGRKLSGDNFSCEISANDTPLFEVNNLCLKNAFEEISFKVMPGEILGITGLLGSGRTELAMSLFGLYPADSGEIKIKGKTVKIHSPQDALKHKIAYVPEDRLTEGLFLLQSIKNNISIANLDALSDKSGRVNKSAVERDAIKWTENLSIMFRDIEDAIGTLSGGNQQKVVLAKWLETNPDVLVLNGPTVGVDIGAKFDLHAHIRNIVKDKTTAVIIISDDLLEVIQNCNRILCY